MSHDDSLDSGRLSGNCTRLYPAWSSARFWSRRRCQEPSWAQQRTLPPLPSAVAAAPLAARAAAGSVALSGISTGLDAHPTPGTRSAAYRLLNETKLGSLLEDLGVQAIEILQETVPPTKRINGVDIVKLVKQVARDGFVLAVSGKPPNSSWIVARASSGDRPELKQLLETVLAGRPARHDEEPEPESGPVQKAGRTLNRLGAGRRLVGREG